MHVCRSQLWGKKEKKNSQNYDTLNTLLTVFMIAGCICIDLSLTANMHIPPSPLNL